MTSKERFVIFSILLVAMLLLPLTLKAATEEELVQEFIESREVKRPHKMIAPFLGISYGKVNPSDYHDFVDKMNGTFLNTTSPSQGALSGIFRITSFETGFGIGVDKGLLTFGFNYWLTTGSANRGDYRYLVDLQTSTFDEIEDFTFKSKLKIWGVYLDYQYFFMNPPIPFVKPQGLAARAGGGIGYYVGHWHLWDGFGGIRSDTGEWYELEDYLKGSGPGFHIGAGAEYPLWRDFILAFDVKYLWLNFDKMRKKLSQTSELILLDSVEGDPVQLNLSGPRAVLSIKHYFTL